MVTSRQPFRNNFKAPLARRLFNVIADRGSGEGEGRCEHDGPSGAVAAISAVKNEKGFKTKTLPPTKSVPTGTR